MLHKLQAIKERFEDVKLELTRPDVASDMKTFTSLSREYKELEKIVTATHAYELILANLTSTKNLLDKETDEEMRAMAKEELEELEKNQERLEEEIKQLLVPKDPEDSKNVILEIRGGTGGDEASLFAGDLFRMYQRYAEKKGWKVVINSYQEGTMGGFKEIIATISGEDAFGILKFESGVHRVQRVPNTETQGRVHTSAATVACMPEMEDYELDLNEKDIRIDLFNASGPGGQSVNTTYSAVRMVHIPTGLTVSMQDEKSQHKNKEKALRILKARIYDQEMQKRNEERSSLRKSYVSSGDRSAKIRTYNFPQSRLTDHRIGLTVYNLPAIMDGELDEVVEALRIAENTEKLKEGN